MKKLKFDKTLKTVTYITEVCKPTKLPKPTIKQITIMDENKFLRDWIWINLDKHSLLEDTNNLPFHPTKKLKEIVLFTNYGSLSIKRPSKKRNGSKRKNSKESR